MDNFYGSNGIFCFRPKHLKLDVKLPTSDIKAHLFNLTLVSSHSASSAYKKLVVNNLNIYHIYQPARFDF